MYLPLFPSPSSSSPLLFLLSVWRPSLYLYDCPLIDDVMQPLGSGGRSLQINDVGTTEENIILSITSSPLLYLSLPYLPLSFFSTSLSSLSLFTTSLSLLYWAKQYPSLGTCHSSAPPPPLSVVHAPLVSLTPFTCSLTCL